MLGVFIAVIGALLLTVVLPLLSLARAAAARDAVARLERRIAALEDQLRREPPTPSPSAETSVAPVAPGAHASPPSVAAPVAQAPTSAPAPHREAAPERPVKTSETRETTATPLETRIGERWMLYVGVAALVVGVGLFVRYAFANQWITEPLRVALGGLVGGLVLATGRRTAVAGHRRFGATLIGGGIAIWYLAVYAALNLYGVLPVSIGFPLLVLVTAVGAVHADRLRSLPLATVAVLGGFGTPFLVGSVANSHLGFFCYTTLLVAAIVYLAHRRDWPALNLTSFLLTGLTVLIWHVRFYRPSTYLTTELFFTVYAGLFVWVLQRMRRSAHPHARWVRLALWTTPAWYHLASLWILEPQRLAFLVYLITVTGVGVVLSVRREAMWTRLLLWVVVAAPLFDWADTQPDPTWLVPAAVTWLAIACMHVAAQVELVRRIRTRVHAADAVLVPATGLLLFVGLRAALGPSRYALSGFVAAALAMSYGALTVAVRRIDARAAAHTRVVAITLAVVAVAVHLHGAWFAILLVTEAVGLVWLGLRERRVWLRGVGAGLFGIAVSQLLALQFEAIPAAYTVILNQRGLLGFFVVGGLGYVASMHARDDGGRREHRIALATAIVAGNLLMLVTLSTEIHAFWALRDVAASAELARQMMLSATWAAYATALTAAGIKRHYAPMRYLAIAIFSVTVVKVFTVDFSQLDSFYRIVSSIALGGLLVGASYLYHTYGTLPPPPTESER